MILTDTLSGTEPPLAAVGATNSVYLQVNPDGRITTWTKTSGTGWEIKLITSGAGSFVSTNVVRVDSNGSNATGTVGALDKPFLTVQAAITALQSLDPIPGCPVIDIGNNYFNEDLVTTLHRLVIKGEAFIPQELTDIYVKPFHSITLPNFGYILLHNVGWGNEERDPDDSNSAIIGTGGSNHRVYVYLVNAQVASVSISGTSQIALYGTGLTDICRTTDSHTLFVSNAQSGGLYYDQSGNPSVTPGAATIFPDSDPHIAGAGYWVAGALVKSVG